VYISLLELFFARLMLYLVSGGPICRILGGIDVLHIMSPAGSNRIFDGVGKCLR
jgi:hypothetical protein